MFSVLTLALPQYVKSVIITCGVSLFVSPRDVIQNDQCPDEILECVYHTVWNVFFEEMFWSFIVG